MTETAEIAPEHDALGGRVRGRCVLVGGAPRAAPRTTSRTTKGRVPRAAAFAAALLVGVGGVAMPSAGARAQDAVTSFFDRLFGRPQSPPVPPGSIPGRPPGVAPAPPGMEGGTEGPRPAPAAPAPPKPVVLRAPSEDTVLGRDLLENGAAGTLRLERAGGAYTARVTLPGSRVSNPGEACTVPLSGAEPIALTDDGRPEGVTRLEPTAPKAAEGTDGYCPLRFDLVEGAVLVTLAGEPGAVPEACTFAAADCRTEPRGLWGPAGASLIPRAAEFEQARGGADKAVRENYRALTQRARPQDVRAVVAGQAAFSSEREQTCRSYAREGAHGFCHLRFTEARGLSLAARLGVAIVASNPASGAPATPRPRPRRPAANEGDPSAGILPE